MPPSNHQKRTADTLVSTSPGESSTSTPAEVSLEHQDTRKRRRVTTSARVQSPDSNVIDIDNHELQALANEVSNGSLDLRQMKIKEEQAAAEKAAKEEAERKEQRKNWTRLAAFQCAICMDSATNLTVTHCGMFTPDIRKVQTANLFPTSRPYVLHGVSNVCSKC